MMKRWKSEEEWNVHAEESLRKADEGLVEDDKILVKGADESNIAVYEMIHSMPDSTHEEFKEKLKARQAFFKMVWSQEKLLESIREVK